MNRMLMLTFIVACAGRSASPAVNDGTTQPGDLPTEIVESSAVEPDSPHNLPTIPGAGEGFHCLTAPDGIRECFRQLERCDMRRDRLTPKPSECTPQERASCFYVTDKLQMIGVWLCYGNAPDCARMFAETRTEKPDIRSYQPCQEMARLPVHDSRRLAGAL